MDALFVLYDETCAFCCRCAEWLERQPTFVPLAVLPAGAARTKAAFPLGEHGKQELVVVGGDGGVYRDTDAWLMVLWALRDFREWAVRLSRGDRHFARKVVGLAGSWRHGLSQLFKVSSQAELRRQLEVLPVSPSCDEASCDAPQCRSCGVPTRPGHSFCAKCLAEALRT
jgi:predicted DCC family thiol-disulfide oxidoreductase YuxK